VVIGSRCGLQGWRSRGPAASGPAELGYCFWAKNGMGWDGMGRAEQSRAESSRVE
jgi:hypothetical protein